jgi:gliding motility-associated-like protein
MKSILAGKQSRYFWVIILGCASLFMPNEIFASHIVGGDLTYRCLGNNNYEIRLTMRRDCFLGDEDAQFDNPASIGFFDGISGDALTFVGLNGQILIPFNEDDTLNQIFISDCTITGNDVCVHQTTYVDTVQLPLRPAGYMMAYQRCCRNASLNNVVEPLNTGMTITALLTNEAQQACNSSPDLGPYPPIYICVNDSIEYDFSAVDADGDSLAYCLFTPNAGGSQLINKPQPPPQPPYDTINWVSPPYGLDNLMGGSPLRIDPHTGIITGRPNTIGQFLVGVCITSYKNGVLIETATREWQYNVRMCRDVPEADFTVLPAELNCDSLTFDFINNSAKSDEFVWIFDYGNPNSQTSTDTNVSFTFPLEGFYDVALIANDIEMICYDTIVVTVGAFQSEVTADFTFEVTECTEDVQLSVTDLSNEPNPDYGIASWDWTLTYGDTSVHSDQQNPNFVLDSSYKDVQLDLVVTSENGCTDETSQMFDVNLIKLVFFGDSIHICAGDSTRFLSNPNPEFDYIWSPTDQLDLSDPSNPLAYPQETTTYYVTATDGICTVESQVVVTVQALAELDFNILTDCKSLAIDLVNNSNGILFSWDFGDPQTDQDTSTLSNPSYTYQLPGVYTVTLYSADGCDVSLQKEVTVSEITATIGDTEISCFLEPVVLNPGGNQAYDYQWSPPDLLDNATAVSPIATINNETDFYVTITDPQLPGCSITDSVTVIVPPDFELGSPGDTAYCGAPDILLSGSNADLTYEWFTAEGESLGSGSVTVSPMDETDYIIIGTDSFGCSKDDTITLNPTFFAISMSSDTTICKGDTISISVSNLDPTQDLEYLWSPEEFIIGPADVAQPTVAPDVNTTFTVMINNQTLGCTLEESITVLVSEFNLSYSSEVTICQGDSIEISITNLDTTNLEYSWSPSEDIISGADTGSPLVSPDDNTTYTVVITNADYGCVTMEESITVLVSKFDLIIEQPPTICQGESIELNVLNLDTSNLEFSWEPVESIIDGQDTATPTVMPNENTTYTVTITNTDLGCETIEMVTVLVSQFDLVVDPPVMICLGESTVIGVMNLDTSNLEFSWSPVESILEGADTATPTVMPTETTTYTVTITNVDLGCTTEESVTVTVNWFDPEFLEVYSDPDTIIINESVLLSTNQDNTHDFLWDGPGLDNPTSPTPTATPMEDATYCVTVTNEFGCVISGCLPNPVVVQDPFCDERDIFIPNAFSPNGDGINDVLFVRGNFIIGMELHIYNRWGQEVFVSQNQSNGWDGTFDGEELETDVFGYYLRVECPNDEFYNTQGNITLFR